jgi:hypothetical protein
MTWSFFSFHSRDESFTQKMPSYGTLRISWFSTNKINRKLLDNCMINSLNPFLYSPFITAAIFSLTLPEIRESY